MKTRRLKQFAASFLVVLSLFASSIAACGCPHHREKSETVVPSRHQHSAENQSAEANQMSEDSATFEANDCICAESAPRVFAKSEIVKIEKQTAAISLNVTISVELTARVAAVETTDYSKPLYLTDSFYNRQKSKKTKPSAKKTEQI